MGCDYIASSITRRSVSSKCANAKVTDTWCQSKLDEIRKGVNFFITTAELPDNKLVFITTTKRNGVKKDYLVEMKFKEIQK
jgi:hypothetical protein